MTTLAQISETQAQKATTANENFDALAYAGLFGRRAAGISGLTWAYYGGILYVAGVATAIADGTVALTLNLTNYVEATTAGVVSANTVGFTAGRMPLYTVVCGATTISSYADQRSRNLVGDFTAKGNVTIGGTLGVTGATTFSSTVDVAGNFSVATNKFTVAAASGNTVVAGTLKAGSSSAAGGSILSVLDAAATGTTLLANIIASIRGNASGADVTLQFSDNVANEARISMKGSNLTFAPGGVEQVRVNYTAAATRYITLTGSNGGNPTISVSAGSLAFGADVQGSTGTMTGTFQAGTFTDGYVTWSLAQINRTSGSIEMQFNGTGTNNFRAFGNIAIPAGGTAGMGYVWSSTTNFGMFFGSGAPTLGAAKGSLYLRSDGSGTTNRAYINTDGGTTWTAITTSA